LCSACRLPLRQTNVAFFAREQPIANMALSTAAARMGARHAEFGCGTDRTLRDTSDVPSASGMRRSTRRELSGMELHEVAHGTSPPRL
jgi:hypothetical protein